MKRKTIAGILTAAVLSCSLLAGCSEDRGDDRGSVNEREEKPTEASEKPAETPTPTPEPVTEPVPAPTEAPAPVEMDYRLLELSKYDRMNYYYDTELDFEAVRVEATHIELLDDDLPELKKAIDDYSRDKEKIVEEENFQKNVDTVKELNSDGNSYNMSIYQKYDTEVVRADTVVTSLLTYFEDYEGGAHGVYYYNPVNFDSVTGEEIHISDIMDQDMIDRLPGILEEKLLEKYDPEIFFDASPEIANTISESYSMNGDYRFSIGYEGLTFYFQIYELAPYVAGHQQITLTYDEFPELVDERISDCSFNYFVNLEALAGNLPHSEDEIYAYFTDMDKDEMFYETLVVNLNGKDHKFSIAAYGGDFWIGTIGGENYLFVNMLHENDYNSLDVYTLSGGEVEPAAEFFGGFYQYVPCDPLNFRIYERTDMLSTYSVYRHYYISRSGMPASTDEFYLADMDKDVIELTVAKPVEAQIRENVSDETYTETTLNAGERLYFYATDRETWVDFLLDSGNIARIYIDGTEVYPQTIGGVNVEDIFNGIRYAG